MVYQYGPSGTDRHAKYSEIEWGPKVERDCPACLTTGTQKQPRKQRPERGSVAIHGTESQLQRAINALEEKEQ